MPSSSGYKVLSPLLLLHITAASVGRESVKPERLPVAARNQRVQLSSNAPPSHDNSQIPAKPKKELLLHSGLLKLFSMLLEASNRLSL